MSFETPASSGMPGPGEMQRWVGSELARLLNRDLVVAVHAHVRARSRESLHQVVGEGVVVVDQEEPRQRAPPRAHGSGPLSGSFR